MMKIAEVMTTDLASCKVTDSLNRAAQLMWDQRCGCIPVIDEGGRAVGMLTDRDVCMAAYTQGRRLDDIAAASAMSRPARTCSPATSVEEAEDIMMAHGVRRLVVVDGAGHPVGLASLDDIARLGAAWDGKGDVDLERVALTLGEISRLHIRIDEDTPAHDVADSDLVGFVQSSLDALRTLRDEIRVDINLGSKELRDRWRRLEVRLHASEVHAHQARQEAARNLTSLVESAKQFRRRLREKTPAATAQPR